MQQQPDDVLPRTPAVLPCFEALLLLNQQEASEQPAAQEAEGQPPYRSSYSSSSRRGPLSTAVLAWGPLCVCTLGNGTRKEKGRGVVLAPVGVADRIWGLGRKV